MNPVVKKLIPVGVLVLASSAAMAGLVVVTPVTVTLNPDGSGSANGSMSAARFSKDVVQHIGCGVRRIEDGVGGVGVFGFCQAANAANVQGFCETDNPALIASIGDQDDYSFVTFSWDSNGVCRSIGNSTRSFYIPDK
jgi:hypothetical protein